MTIKIVGLSGFKRTGKDTAAGYLHSHHGLMPFAFADNVKKTAMAMFGLTGMQVYGTHGYDREQVLPEWGISVREILQKVGTECGRDIFGMDIWIKRLQVDINAIPGIPYLVSDVRFDNEAKWILDSGGIVIDIQREGCNPDGHRSESGITEFNYQVYNDGTLEEFYDLLDQLMEDHYGK